MNKLKLALDNFNDISFFETKNDYEFFKRVYNEGDLLKYIKRIKAINFTGKNKILDHGCGFGQWSFALSELNEAIDSYDISKNRILIANELKNKSGITNICFNSLIDYTSLNNSYDGIFSYGVLQCVDYIKMLKNYYSLLKPGGHLYFTAADLGWYLYYIIDGHNDTDNFSTRDWGIGAIKNSLSYLRNGDYLEGQNICIPYDKIEYELEKIGFKLLNIGPDGSINYDQNIKCDNFFPFEKYNNKAVYEVLCEKIER